MRSLLLFTLLIPLAAFSQDRSLVITDMHQLDTVLRPEEYNTLFVNTTDPLNRVHYTARLNKFMNINTAYYQGQKVIIEADTDVRYIPGIIFYTEHHEERELLIDQSAINKLTWVKVSEGIKLTSNGYRTKPISLQINRVTIENPIRPVFFDSLFWGNGHFYRFEIFESAESLFTRSMSDIVLAPGQQYIPIPGINYSQFRSYEAVLSSKRINSQTAFQVIQQSLKGSAFDIHEIRLENQNLSIGFVERSPVFLKLLRGLSNGFKPELLDNFRPNMVITHTQATKELWRFLVAQQNSRIMADIKAHISKKVLKRMGHSSNNYYLVLSDIAWQNKKITGDEEAKAYAQKLQEKYRTFLKKKHITNVQIEVIVGT